MLLLFALIALATAAPVELPADVDLQAWTPALALAGLVPGTVGSGPGVRVQETAGAWSVWVRDEGGEVHQVGVDPPVSQSSREALVHIAASLLRPVEEVLAGLPALPSLPALTPPVAVAAAEPVEHSDARAPEPEPVPAPPPEPPISKPAEPAERAEPAAPVADPPPEPADSVLEPPEPGSAGEPDAVADAIEDPIPDVDGMTEPVVAEIPAPVSQGSVSPWFALAPSLRLRPSVRSMAAAELWGGLHSGFLRAGIGTVVTAPRALLQSSGLRRMQTVDVLGIAQLDLGRVSVGPHGGVSRRDFRDPDSSRPDLFPITAWIPVLGPAVSYRTGPAGPIAARFAFAGAFDIVPVDLTFPADTANGSTTSAASDSPSAVRLPVLELGLSVGVSLGSKAGDRSRR